MLRWSLAVALAGGLLSLSTMTLAQQARPDSNDAATGAEAASEASAADETSAPAEQPEPEKEIPVVNLFDGVRAGVITAKAEGREDGDMTISVTNRSNRQLRVVLPPGLIATGATGQFGGGMMGGRGGMGGMGGGMGGMGGGGFGGGGMGGGGLGGFGGGPGSSQNAGIATATASDGTAAETRRCLATCG